MRKSIERVELVHEFVERTFSGSLHAKRIFSLANGTLGVLTGASLAVSVIGHALAQARGLADRHAIKQVDRLLSNAGVVVWDLFAPWVREVVGQRKAIVVAMDWTDFDADNQATLALSLITRHGRATPLLWLTVDKDELKDQRNDFEDLCLTSGIPSFRERPDFGAFRPSRRANGEPEGPAFVVARPLSRRLRDPNLHFRSCQYETRRIKMPTSSCILALEKMRGWLSCLTHLKAILPEGVAVTILADRGFGDVKLFEFLNSLGFGYVIRFRGNVHVTAADGETRLAADGSPRKGAPAFCAAPNSPPPATRSARRSASTPRG